MRAHSAASIPPPAKKATSAATRSPGGTTAAARIGRGPRAVEAPRALAQVPERILEQVAAVAGTSRQLGRQPRLQPLEQRDRVVGQAVPEAIAPVVAVAAQLVGFGDPLDRPPPDELVE